jgi:hypothetical protein
MRVEIGEIMAMIFILCFLYGAMVATIVLAVLLEERMTRGT